MQWDVQEISFLQNCNRWAVGVVCGLSLKSGALSHCEAATHTQAQTYVHTYIHTCVLYSTAAVAKTETNGLHSRLRGGGRLEQQTVRI